MTALAQFQANITAADKLVEMYRELRRYRQLGARGRLDAENVDLLWLPRSAVVACMSALDTYIHTVIYERIPNALRGNPVPQALCDAMISVVKIKNGNEFREALPIFSIPDSLTELTNRLRIEMLAFQSYQAPEKIVGAYKLLGREDIFNDVADLWPGPNSTAEDIKRRLIRYVNRRNQIAHEGDVEINGEPRHIQPEYATDCRDYTFSLVTRLDQVIYGV